MAGTRSSNRNSGSRDSSPKSSPGLGTKRKAAEDVSPNSKEKSGQIKHQKTIEESISDADMETAATKHSEQFTVEDDGAASGKSERQQSSSVSQKNQDHTSRDALATKASNEKENTSLDDTGKLEAKDPQDRDDGRSLNANGSVEISEERKAAAPSNILERGIMYFFSRGRVGVDDVESVQDIARSYMVLRPLPTGVKLSEGSLPDLENNRLLALPKKVLPKSHRDTFMTFVEKAGVTIASLKDDFAGSEYDTKTTGTRHAPAATPMAEGIYAITTTGRDSHLAYMLTLPSDLGEVQKDIGFREKGSFVLSVKNPEQEGPANTNLPQKPEFPKDVLEEFRGLRWLPLQPKHLDYPNAQFLLIGEAAGELGKAVEQTTKDEKHDKDTPLQHLEKLEEDETHRAETLKGDDLVFVDLGMSHKEYPKLKTSW